MKSLLYRSIARSDLKPEVVFEIIEHSSRANGAKGLTGFLLFHEGRFLQLLEGPADRLDDLFDTMKADTRHHDVEVLFEGKVARPSFPNWRMRRVATKDSGAALDTLMHAQDYPLPRAILAKVVAFLDHDTTSRDRAGVS
ncbi:MAG: BLUF domain-containing protein [Erythrobacter sp.]|uniref:BLUF domain-containing protein n=1 Tax=Erythrobacter sp. TaxID=1042 RepID=UPI003C71F0E3